MFVGLQSIVDTLKQLLQTLQVSFLFPATALIVFSLLLYPGEISIEISALVPLILILIIIVSNLLFAFNGLIIRFLEGYVHSDVWLLSLLTNWAFDISKRLERRHFQKISNKIAICNKKMERIKTFLQRYNATEKSEISHELKTYYNKNKDRIREIFDNERGKRDMLEAELKLRFPSLENEFLPTALGNTMSAFEAYPAERYGMDAVALYPRLLPILEEKKFLPFLQIQKNTLDFLLNTCVVSFFLWCEEFVFFVMADWSWKHLGLFFLLFFLTVILYHSAVFVAKDWGTLVCTAFDLYRNDLRLALNLKDIDDECLDKEREMWETISDFIVYADTKNFKGFVYSRQQAK